MDVCAYLFGDQGIVKGCDAPAVAGRDEHHREDGLVLASERPGRRVQLGADVGDDHIAGKRAGLILSGGNIDMAIFAQILRGETPTI